MTFISGFVLGGLDRGGRDFKMEVIKTETEIKNESNKNGSSMGKKIALVIGVIIILGFGGGGFFYWWQNQAGVRELNKDLPQGVRVEKSLFGDEYRVVNKIDGYEFKVPDGWHGLGMVEYIPKRSESGYTAASISMEGKEGTGRIVTIDQFRIENAKKIDLKSWAESNFETFGLVGNFSKDEIGHIEIVKTREDVHLLGMSVYFFKKNSTIYAITGGSEDFIREIILNGKW
jgi:hypothetical protein